MRLGCDQLTSYFPYWIGTDALRFIVSMGCRSNQQCRRPQRYHISHRFVLCVPCSCPSVHPELVGTLVVQVVHGMSNCSFLPPQAHILSHSLRSSQILLYSGGDNDTTQGLGMGIKVSTIPVFSAEVAPASVRGGLVTSFQLWVAFGIFVGFCSNLVFFQVGRLAWRFQLAAAFAPAVPILFLVWLCPGKNLRSVSKRNNVDCHIICIKNMNSKMTNHLLNSSLQNPHAGL